MSKSWAEERLGQWLREYDAGSADAVLDELREYVTHLAECDQMDRSCARLTDECTGDEPCDHCATPCEECVWYREGHQGKWSQNRSVFELLDELESRLFDIEESAA